VKLDIHKKSPASVNTDRALSDQSPGPLITYQSEFTARDPVTATLAAVLVLLDGTTPAANVIAFTLEITRMTAGTERRVS